MISVIKSLIDYSSNFQFSRLSPNFSVGERKSPFLGSGNDFYQIREFDSERDDLRRVANIETADGRALVRESRILKRLDTIFLVDLSSSIWTGGLDKESGLSNKEWLLLWAFGSLGITVSGAQDRVGLVGFADNVIMDIFPKGGKGHVYHTLGEVNKFLQVKSGPGRKGDMNSALELVRRRYIKPSLIVLISDFINYENIHKSQLIRDIVARHNTAAIILDDLKSLPASGILGMKSVRMWDVESNKFKNVSLRKIRKAKNRIIKKRTILRKELVRLGVVSTVISRDNYNKSMAEFIEAMKY